MWRGGRAAMSRILRPVRRTVGESFATPTVRKEDLMLLQRFVRVHRWSIRSIALMVPFLFPSPSHAIPAFARMYGLSCSTCHIDFPKLNDFGKAFKDAGFKFPQEDASRIK